MPQIKARECGATAKEESVFAGEEGCQNIFLQTVQLTVFQSAPLAARSQAETPRNGPAAPNEAPQPAICSKRLLETRRSTPPCRELHATACRAGAPARPAKRTSDAV